MAEYAIRRAHSALVDISLEERLRFDSLVFRNPLAGLSKGFRLLVVDALLGFKSHSSGLGEGHAENVVSLDATADSTVAGDGLTKVQCDVDILLGGGGLGLLGGNFSNDGAGGLKFKCQL